MSTNYPDAIDTLTNPTTEDYEDVLSHAAQHANANDAIEALQAKVGADSSAVATSHDYKIAALEEALPTGDIVGTTDEQTLENKTFTSPVLNTPSFSAGAVGTADIAAGAITTAKTEAERQKGWEALASALTYQSPTTASGTDLLDQLEPGDKVKFNQSIPLTAYFTLATKDPLVGVFTVADIGTPTYTAGKFGNALTLDGATDALSITDAALLKPTGAFTIGCWVKRGATGATHTVFQSYSDNTNANGIRVYIYSNDKIYVSSGANGADPTEISGATSIDTNWHHVVISYQANHCKIFLDGVLDGSGYLPTPTYAATNYVRIGCGNVTGSNTFWFNGQIDDLFFINGHAVDKYWVAAKYVENTAQGTGNITATYKGYVTAVTDTLLTVNGGADYALYNGTITNPYYSHGNAVGFPANSKTFSPLGVWYSEITSDFTTTTTPSAVDVTNLTITVTVPTGRSIKLTAIAPALQTSAAAGTVMGLMVREDSTVKASAQIKISTASYYQPVMAVAVIAPTAGAHIYKVSVSQTAAGTITVNSSSGQPTFLMAEII